MEDKLFEAAQAAHQQYWESVNELAQKREDEKGDAALIVLAALLMGRKGFLSREYILGKLSQLSASALPINVLDPFGLRRFATAVKDHPEDPIGWLIEQGAK